MRRLLTLATLAALATACRSESNPPARSRPPATSATPSAPDWTGPRDRMVDESIAGRGVADARVLQAMRRVPRHELVPAALRDRAYQDRPLPIGHGQTISQPYVVAAMTEAAELTAGERVLEVGTGSGYQAAVLAELGDVEVYSIEIVEPLAKQTHELLRRLGYTKVNVRIGDGYRGWPEAAPFDAIIVTAAPPEVPKPLIDQLAPGGRMVIPVGGREQYLQVITKHPDGSTTTENLFEVRFVPMTGEAQHDPT
jgi:protein-L-isoaspartate(D-aspartate) O-methyltransferase